MKGLPGICLWKDGVILCLAVVNGEVGSAALLSLLSFPVPLTPSALLGHSGKESKEPQGFLSSSSQSRLCTEVLFIVTHMQILPVAGNFAT